MLQSQKNGKTQVASPACLASVRSTRAEAIEDFLSAAN